MGNCAALRGKICLLRGKLRGFSLTLFLISICITLIAWYLWMSCNPQISKWSYFLARIFLKCVSNSCLFSNWGNISGKKRYLWAHRKTILVFVQTHFGIVFLCYYSIAMVCFSSNVTVILNFDLCATSTSNSSKVCYQTTPCVSIDSSVNTITGTKQQKKLPCCCLQNNLINKDVFK